LLISFVFEEIVVFVLILIVGPEKGVVVDDVVDVVIVGCTQHFVDSLQSQLVDGHDPVYLQQQGIVKTQ
jgi:hypothetical protein